MVKLILFILSISSFLFSCNSGNSANSNNKSDEVATSSVIEDVEVKDSLSFTDGVRAILHDSKGNYWFGSHRDGVCRYDGNTFTYFTMEDGLASNQVRRVLEDEEGLIWFGTSNGPCSYDGQSITNYNEKIDFGISIVKIDINHQRTHSPWSKGEKDLWFNGGQNLGVYHYDGRSVRFHSFPLGDEQKDHGGLYQATEFSKGRGNKIWIATYGAVFGYDGYDFTFLSEAQLGMEKGKNQLHIRSILEDSKGNLWIGNNGIGVLLKTGDETINFSGQQRLIKDDSRTYLTNMFPHTLEHVFAIGEDTKGNIWFGDRDTGAWKYDGKSMKNYGKKDGLTGTHIWHIYEDNDGRLLFAMGNGNVLQFENERFRKAF